jgi:phosphoribosylamine---glycine ligase
MKGLKVLVVGGGGREHALSWKLAQSPLVSRLYCAPGNPGTAAVATSVPIPADDVRRLADFAAAERIDLTVVGPELPLSLGLADELAARGLPVFGPGRAAAELEGSKAFAKEFMARHGIPTAPFELAASAGEAREAARRFGFPVVLKADGLAAGKGVFVVSDPADLEEAIAALFLERRFGAAGERAVVEACLAGEEVSFMALSDGRSLLPLATAKDYKRIGEGDTGPNTGGMGSHSPAGVVDEAEAARFLEEICRPVVDGMAAEGRPFVGVLYAGLMLTADGPRVLEFNARFGDPEAQVLLLRMEDDLAAVLAAGAAGRFDAARLRFRQEVAACVVLAGAGYPGKPVTGEPIAGLDRAAALPGVQVFHAGTAFDAGPEHRVVSAGGRVLDICATGPDLAGALERAYAAVAAIDWPSKVFRRDIGRRLLAGPFRA